jgi:hypothetical protein
MIGIIKTASLLAISATLITLPTMTCAQTVSQEVQCVLVSNALATGSSNPKGRQIGASVGAYFMGRLDMRQTSQVKSALSIQKRQVPASKIGAIMNACTARAGRAEAKLRALTK